MCEKIIGRCQHCECETEIENHKSYGWSCPICIQNIEHVFGFFKKDESVTNVEP